MTIVYDPSDDLEIAIYKIFNKFVGQIIVDPAYLMDSNFIAPSGPYVVLKLNDIEPVSSYTGWQSAIVDETFEQSSYNNFIGYANVYTYGSRALSKAQKIAFATKDNNLRKLLSDNGIGISNTSRVRNASRALSGTEMEERAQFSISFNFVQYLTTVNPYGVIEQINAEGDLIDATGDIDTETSSSASDPTPLP